jgi:hypothetical protein
MVEPDNPNLDGTPGSLSAVNRRILTRVVEQRWGDPAELPSWWNRAMPTATGACPDAEPLSSAQLALIYEIEAHLAEVIANARPDSE